MQLDQNSFYGNFVLDSVNTAFKDGEKLFDKQYKKQLFSDFLWRF